MGGIRGQHAVMELTNVASVTSAGSGLLRRGTAAQRGPGGQGRLHRRLVEQRDDGYQAMRWSNSKSGPGWPRRSQPGSGSGASSQAEQPRAGAIGDLNDAHG